MENKFGLAGVGVRAVMLLLGIMCGMWITNTWFGKMVSAVFGVFS